MKMKKLIAVALLLPIAVCATSSCEDQTEEFDSIQSQSIENSEMMTDDRLDGSEPEPKAP